MRMPHATMRDVDEGVALLENITICHFLGGRQVIDLMGLEIICSNDA